jgi:hypothetical protein
MDLRIRIRTKILWIRNTALYKEKQIHTCNTNLWYSLSVTFTEFKLCTHADILTYRIFNFAQR